MNEDAPQGLPSPEGYFYVKVPTHIILISATSWMPTYHNGNIIAEEIPLRIAFLWKKYYRKKKELDTEIVLDTMINVNEF